jgi:hypothetical protein
MTVTRGRRRRLRARIWPYKHLTVDPAGCVCIQCVVGDSVPAQRLRESHKDQIVEHYNVTDRTGYSEMEWEPWLMPR